MKTDHERVIEFLARPDLDYRALVYAMAEKNPAALLSVSADRWKARAREMLTNGEYVEVIKFCRNETGMSLKDAKDAVDAMKRAA
jgi:ribosomal protein L7/L12